MEPTESSATGIDSGEVLVLVADLTAIIGLVGMAVIGVYAGFAAYKWIKRFL